MKLYSISAKLLAAFAVAIVLAILATIQPIQAARGAQARFATVFADRVVPLEQLGLMLYGVNAATDAQRAGGSIQRTPSDVIVQQVDSLWKAYIITYLTPEESRLVDGLRTPMKDWMAAMEASIGGDATAAVRGEALHHALDDGIRALMALQVRVARDELNAAGRTTGNGVQLSRRILNKPGIANHTFHAGFKNLGHPPAGGYHTPGQHGRSHLAVFVQNR